ncbi:hypothetical protein [Gemmata sp.]|uniref:hypothetical protein n=1 Tax=Gemmata sp. TaxID=1914242 RepID=UPI003F726817
MSEATPPEPSADVPKLLTDVLGRLNALEREVAALRTERTSLGSLVPYTPPTEEELQDMLHGPRGQPILQVIEEYERKYLGR